jgi:hypothetical protein
MIDTFDNFDRSFRIINNKIDFLEHLADIILINRLIFID